MYQKPATPTTMFKVFTESFKLYRHAFWQTILFSFIAALVSAQTATRLADDHDFIFNTMSFFRLNWGFVVYSLVVLLIVAWSYGAIFYQLNQKMNGERARLAKASLHGLVQLPSLLANIFLYSLVFMFGIIIFIVPGIIVGVSCILAIAIVGIGQKNPITALLESHRLVWPHWWRALILAILPLICFLVIGFVGNHLSIEAFVHTQHSLNYLLMIRIVSSIVLGSLYAPWFYSLMLLILNDLRIRNQLESKASDEFIDTFDEEENFLEKNT